MSEHAATIGIVTPEYLVLVSMAMTGHLKLVYLSAFQPVAKKKKNKTNKHAI